MFERYTEKARRVIFFARYEASQFGSTYIETEHLLLALLREDKALTQRFQLQADSIRSDIEPVTVIREKVSSSVDLPLSSEAKRVLAYASEEAENLGNKHIGTEHFLLGLLREEGSLAAQLLHKNGLTLTSTRKAISKAVPSGGIVHESLAGDDTPWIEFVEDGRVLSEMPVFNPLPRAGDEIVLRLQEGTSAYRVEKVRFVLVKISNAEVPTGHKLNVIQVLVRKIPSV